MHVLLIKQKDKKKLNISLILNLICFFKKVLNNHTQLSFSHSHKLNIKLGIMYFNHK